MLAADLAIEPGHVVVDLGCGTGEMVERLTQLCGNATVIGVDISQELLQLARSQSSAPRLVCASADHLPLGQRSVDRVLVQRVLMHLPRWCSVLEEAARILRPGGLIVISEPTWSRYEFVSDDPELDARMVDLMQHGVAVPDVGERLSAALRSVDLNVLTQSWVSTTRPIDSSRYAPLAAQLTQNLPRPRTDRWLASWQAPRSHTVSHVRHLVASTD